MNDGHVKQTVADGIASVTFHHPKGNSLPGHVLRDLAAAIGKAGADPSVRVVILRSEGEKAFCAGASFDELLAVRTADQGLTFFSGFAHVINAVRTAACPVIGRVHAKAVGGGVGLAAACDFSYAHRDASARLSELAIGIGPFVVGPAVERKVGAGAFGLMSFTPTVWRDAEWCLRHGLYASVHATEQELDRTVEAHARELAGYSPEAMRELKAVLWRGTEDWGTLLTERAVISGRLILSDFAVDAINRFKAGAAKR